MRLKTGLMQDLLSERVSVVGLMEIRLRKSGETGDYIDHRAGLEPSPFYLENPACRAGFSR
jgi:hypothetical protein